MSENVKAALALAVFIVVFPAILRALFWWYELVLKGSVL